MSACLLRSRLCFASLSEGGDARASSSHSPPIGEWSLNKGNARKNDSLTAAASSVTKAETMNTTTTTCVSAVSIRKECNYGNEVAQETSFHGGETDTSYLLPIRFYHLRQGRGLSDRFSFSTAPICRISSQTGKGKRVGCRNELSTGNGNINGLAAMCSPFCSFLSVDCGNQ